MHKSTRRPFRFASHIFQAAPSSLLSFLRFYSATKRHSCEPTSTVTYRQRHDNIHYNNRACHSIGEKKNPKYFSCRRNGAISAAIQFNLQILFLDFFAAFVFMIEEFKRLFDRYPPRLSVCSPHAGKLTQKTDFDFLARFKLMKWAPK